MKAKDLCELTNESGKRFLRFSNVEVLGIEERNDAWFYPVVRYSSGQIAVWSLPKKDSDCAASTFGSLEYFAMVHAYDMMPEKEILWMPNGFPVRPIWRNDFSLQEKKTWSKYEKEILEKYS